MGASTLLAPPDEPTWRACTRQVGSRAFMGVGPGRRAQCRKDLLWTLTAGAIGPSWLRRERSYALTALWFALLSTRALALTASLCGVVGGFYLFVAATIVLSTLARCGGWLLGHSQTAQPSPPSPLESGQTRWLG